MLKPPRRGRVRLLCTLAVGLSVSALFLWLAIRQVDLGEVWLVVRAADRMTLGAAAVVVSLVYVAQALRWREIVATERPSRTRYVELVLGGIACNNLLPGRAGEIFRARQLALEADLPSGRGLATIVLDRCFDVATLALFLGIALPAVIDEAWVGRVGAGASLLLAGMAFAIFFARRYTRTHHRDRRTRGRLRCLIRDTLEGLAVSIARRRLAKAGAFSVSAWCLWVFTAFLVARAIGIELGLLDALFVTAAINLGAAIPSSPGFVGTFQWLGVASLGALGVAHEDGLAFAILMHAVWYVPTTLVGLYILSARTDWRAFGRRTERVLPLSPMSASLAGGPATD